MKVEHNERGVLVAVVPILPRTRLFHVKTGEGCAADLRHQLTPELHIAPDDLWHCVESSELELTNVTVNNVRDALQRSATRCNVMIVRDDDHSLVCVARRTIYPSEPLLRVASALELAWGAVRAGKVELDALWSVEMLVLRDARIPKFGLHWPVEKYKECIK